MEQTVRRETLADQKKFPLCYIEKGFMIDKKSALFTCDKNNLFYGIKVTN
jgi:hypothetical protein